MKNCRVRWIFFLFITFVPFILTAQQTIISGTVPGAEGKTIELTTPGDFLTYREKFLAKTVVDFQGQFTISLTIPKTIYANLSIGFRKTGFFIQPDHAHILSCLMHKVLFGGDIQERIS